MPAETAGIERCAAMQQNLSICALAVQGLLVQLARLGGVCRRRTDAGQCLEAGSGLPRSSRRAAAMPHVSRGAVNLPPAPQARSTASRSLPARSRRRAAAAFASSTLQGSDPLLESGKAAFELCQARAAGARCGGGGRGPRCGFAACVVSTVCIVSRTLHRRGHSRQHGRPGTADRRRARQPTNLSRALGAVEADGLRQTAERRKELRVVGECAHVVLPELEIAARQVVNVRLVRHGARV